MMLTLLASAAAQASQPPEWLQFAPFVAMGGVIYFLILRPQMRQQKERQTKLKEITKGDQVVTAGGLIAKVIKVEDETLEIELAPNVRVKAVRSTISDVVVPGARPAAND